MKKYKLFPIFILLIILSIGNSLYLINVNSNTYWGVDILSRNIQTLNGTISTDYIPDYLKLNNNIIPWESRDKADYVILSIYGEAQRMSISCYESHYFGFITRPCSPERPPSWYKFHSELYEKIENDNRFEKVNEIYRGEQRIFIIYKVSYEYQEIFQRK